MLMKNVKYQLNLVSPSPGVWLYPLQGEGRGGDSHHEQGRVGGRHERPPIVCADRYWWVLF